MSRSAGRSRPIDGAAVILVTPVLAGILLFVIVPLGILVWMTLHRWDLLAPPAFVGIANMASVFGDPTITRSLLATAALALLVVPVQTACGLGLALLLRRVGEAAGLYRTLLLLPWAAAPLATGVVWRAIFDPSAGVMSGVTGARVEWLTTPVGAMLIVAFVLVWGGAGYASLFFSVGLSQVSATTLEAARLDGASGALLLGRIVLPQLHRTMLFVVVTSTIQVLATFDVVYALTGAGPGGATDVLALRMHTEAFRVFDLGRGAVIALLLFVAIGLVAAVQVRGFRERPRHA